jgi:hypothetical protein
VDSAGSGGDPVEGFYSLLDMYVFRNYLLKRDIVHFGR